MSNYILTDKETDTIEIEFMIELLKNLKSNDVNDIEIKRTNSINNILYNLNGYCNVDYVVLFKNKFLCYVEHKYRSNATKYYNRNNGLIIGTTKTENIIKCNLMPCFYIWEDNQDKCIYYTQVKEIFNQIPDTKQYDKFNNRYSYIKTIPNKFLKKDYINLINDIKVLIQVKNNL